MIRTSDITSIPDWSDKSDAEILAALTEPLSTVRAGARHDYSGISDKLGQAGYSVSQVRSTITAIRAALVESDPAFADQLAGGGIDFASPLTQAALDDLANETPEVFNEQTVAFLKNLGVDSRSRWQRAHPDEDDPTEEDVTAAVKRVKALDRLARAYNTGVEALEAGEQDGDWNDLMQLLMATPASVEE